MQHCFFKGKAQLTVEQYKRILVVSDLFGPGSAGAGRAAMLLADGLCEIGMPAVAFTVLGQPDPTGRLSQLSPVRTALIKHGWRWRLPERCLLAQLRLSCWRKPPDLIIVMGITSLTRRLLMSPLAGRVAVWETTNANSGNKFIDREAAQNLHRCLAMLSPSASIDKGIRESYGFQGPIVRLPFWVPDVPMACRNKADFTYDFVYLGRLDVEKGIKELLHAFAALCFHRPSKLAICGFGKVQLFQAIATELGISHCVDFFPNASEDSVEKIMMTSRWYVLPSHHEGYPLSILEAARRGIPTIASAVGSIPEMLVDSMTGILVPPRNVEGLVAAFEQVLKESVTDYDLRKKNAYENFIRLSGGQVVRNNIENMSNDLLLLTKSEGDL